MIVKSLTKRELKIWWHMHALSRQTHVNTDGTHDNTNGKSGYFQAITGSALMWILIISKSYMADTEAQLLKQQLSIDTSANSEFSLIKMAS